MRVITIRTLGRSKERNFEHLRRYKMIDQPVPSWKTESPHANNDATMAELYRRKPNVTTTLPERIDTPGSALARAELERLAAKHQGGTQ